MNENKSFYEYYSRLSYSLLNEKKPSEALEAARCAIQFDANSPYPYEYAGIALVRLHKYDEAEVFIRKTLSLNPKRTAMYFYLGHILYFQGDYETAELYITQYHHLHGENYFTLFILGQIYVAQEDYYKALATYKKSLVLKPDYKFSADAKAKILRYLKREDNTPNKDTVL